jgi:hypothetical protein
LRATLFIIHYSIVMAQHPQQKLVKELAPSEYLLGYNIQQ